MCGASRKSWGCFSDMGFYDGTTQAMRVAFFGFCGGLLGVTVSALGMWLGWVFLRYIGVLIVIVSMAIFFWAFFLGDDKRLRRENRN
jgi:ABC-type Mn2+/Zn2+ transport system permease subunit